MLEARSHCEISINIWPCQRVNITIIYVTITITLIYPILLERD